jgi:hypothetical protein
LSRDYFAAINRNAFMAPTTLSVVVATRRRRSGLFCSSSSVCSLYYFCWVYWQSSISWKTGAMRANWRAAEPPIKRKLPGSANSAHFWKGADGSGENRGI